MSSLNGSVAARSEVSNAPMSVAFGEVGGRRAAITLQLPDARTIRQSGVQINQWLHGGPQPVSFGLRPLME
jgi:hypothetical protein